MALYRTVQRIALGEETIQAGQLLSGRRLSERSAQALLRRGAISRVAAPPLAVLPGWKLRGKRMESLGIVDAGQMLEADADEVARHMGVSPGLVKRWQEDVARWLAPPDTKPRG